jgi:outer membrane biosynthesis protein TonB
MLCDDCARSIKSDILTQSSSMHILQTNFRIPRPACLLGVLLWLAASAFAQSTDVAWPSPVRSNEVRGAIAARDIGDPRVTDHFYAFTATPGDLLITVDSRNLNGDIDVFTFNGMRPLLKFTVYAGSSSAITKSIYLRRQEDLILRVEGRTPNDDEAAYRLHFGGAFQPIKSGPLAEHEDAIQESPTVTASRGGRRVSSVGERIEEPRTEVAEAPKPEPTPEATPVEPTVATTKPTTRPSRPRRPVTRRTQPARTPKTTEPVAKNGPEEKPSEGEKSTAETPESEKPAKPTKKGKSTRAAAKTTTPAQEPELSGPRLILETNDGTLIDRYMSTIRRVTVENGQVVVIGKDGKIDRIPLVNVVKMTITQ